MVAVTDHMEKSSSRRSRWGMGGTLGGRSSGSTAASCSPVPPAASYSLQEIGEEQEEEESNHIPHSGEQE